MNDKYIWIGPRVGENRIIELVNKKAKFLSGYVASKGWVDSLERNGIELDSISYLFFPRSIEKKVKNVFETVGSSTRFEAGYLNFPFLRNLLVTVSMKKAAKKWAKDNKDNRAIIFVYEVTSSRLRAAERIKKRIENSEIVLIAPDLPQYMEFGASPIKRFAKKLDGLLIKKLLKKVDKFVLYTEPMKEKLGVGDRPWILMEGFFDFKDYPISSDVQPIGKDDGKISIMYSGLLEKGFGLEKLVEALSYCPKDFEIWFTGAGNYEKELRDKSLSEPRIKVFGFLPSREDLLRLQAQSTALISLRDPNHPSSSFCFPSKIMEYMISGRPVISNRINGIPEEYYKYLITFDDLDPKSLANCLLLLKTLTNEEMSNMTSSARNFILKNKSSDEQVLRVLKWINGDS